MINHFSKKIFLSKYFCFISPKSFVPPFFFFPSQNTIILFLKFALLQELLSHLNYFSKKSYLLLFFRFLSCSYVAIHFASPIELLCKSCDFFFLAAWRVASRKPEKGGSQKISLCGSLSSYSF